MDLKEEKKNEVTVIHFNGRLDATSSNPVFESISRIIDAGNRSLLFDYADLTYISSAGLRTLLLVIKKLNALGGKVVIFGHKDYIKEIFDISGFSSLFKFAENEEQALAEIQK